jgi:hypothetical protein
LEDDLCLSAIRLQLWSAQLRNVDTFKEDGPRRGFNQSQNESPNGGLATAGLTDKPERLASANLKVNTINGAHLSDNTLQRTGAHGEGLSKPAHL